MRMMRFVVEGTEARASQAAQAAETIGCVVSEEEHYHVNDDLKPRERRSGEFKHYEADGSCPDFLLWKVQDTTRDSGQRQMTSEEAQTILSSHGYKVSEVSTARSRCMDLVKKGLFKEIETHLFEITEKGLKAVAATRRGFAAKKEYTSADVREFSRRATS